MKATAAEQLSLLEVQRIDHQLATLANREINLPEIVALKDATIKRNTARDLKIAAETELSDVSRELSRAEGDVEQIVTRIQRDEKRLAAGEGSAKDLEHMQHELGTLAIRRSELEEAELEVMIRVDALKVRISELQGEEDQYLAEIATLDAAMTIALSAIAVERAKLSADREIALGKIGSELASLYSKIASDNFGNGAAALVGNECKGCNLPLNTVEVQRINALPVEEVVRCEQCRCILVRAH